MWTVYRQATASSVDHGLIEAAYAEPELRVLFPYQSHESLHFSRCTRYPYTHDVPAIVPVDGKYRVIGRTARSPHRPVDIGWADNPRDAVALVLARLPPGCGPAVVGTADDLDKEECP
ncbi:DUF6193 family natural product biosynthesis protein [Streptomyces sp. NPDC051018]|uniref:DUF6193 family natural product biosynthesis protein n=1 Tax=Streptomyces sp. NPDC051018 TaxID=3365639 RepID=UPI0037903B95